MDQVAALLSEALRKHYGTQWEKTGNTGHALARSKAAAPYNRCCNHAGKGDPRSPDQKNAFQLPQQDKGKNWGKAGQKANPQGLPAEVQRRALGGEASVNQPEKKQRAYTSRSAQSWQERDSARDLRRPWSLQRTLSPLTPPPHASTTKGMNCRPWP